MKLLVFSDIHLDAVTAGKSRRSEVLEFLGRVVDIARTQAVDSVVFAGDAHDPGQVSDALFAADLIRWTTNLVRSRFAPSFVAVAGNHDVVDSSERFLMEPITSLTPLRAAAACLSEQESQRVHVFERPHLRHISDGNGGAYGVLGLPYVSRAHAKMHVEWDELAFKQAQAFVDAGGKLIVVGHKTIPGAEMSSESVEMARGRDQIFPFEQVSRLKPVLVINGHYHRRQTVKWGGVEIVIPGSPLRFTFGEIEEAEKGVLLVDLS